MRKSLYPMLLALALIVPLLAACGGGATGGTAATSAPVAQATAAPAPTAASAPTTAPAPTAAAEATAAPAPTTAEATAAPEAKTLKVGLVTDVGKVDDKSFNQSAWEGVQQAQKDLSADVKFIETTDPKDYQKNIEQFADANYDVIVTVGFALGEATYQDAKKYPNIKFIGVDQFQAKDDKHPDIPLANLAGLVFEEDKAGYLAGVLAASVSKSGTIGAVCGTDVVPAVWRYGEGYKAGAKSVKPDINVQVVYHSDVGFDKTFTDPEWGNTTGLAMIDKGADVLFGCGGKTGNGALQAAANKGVYAIGVDTDQYLTLPEAQKAMISSAEKLITPGVFGLIKSSQDGSFKGGNNVGPVGLAPFHDLDSKVPADVKAKLQEVDKGLQDGSIKTNVPPTKPS
ncbi:MAG TPA: BMP family ABC transporter substrate-binding protein [Roseiflexaceae bacterium]